MIKLLIIDRDSVITHGSKDPASPFYYIRDPDHLILKPNVREAFDLLNVFRRAHKLKIIMATKQRGISKGLITRAKVDDINATLGYKLGLPFSEIYVEESAETKANLFVTILRDLGARPDETLVIDDSIAECNAAIALGIPAMLVAAYAPIAVGPMPVYKSARSLYHAVCHTFSIT